MMRNKKEERPILVTGGAGFIGSHLVRRLLRDGHKVVVLTKESTDKDRIKDLEKEVVFLWDDLSDAARLEAVFRELRPRGVMHMAASNIKQGATGGEEELIKVNLRGTMNLLKALSGIDYEFFINTGTYLEYGIKERPFRESDLCEPLEIYALSKLGATLYSSATAKNFRKPIITFRIFSPYGPGMERGRLFHEVIKRGLAGEEIYLTSPEVSRDFIFVEDIADLYVEAMEKAESLKGEIFNLGFGQARTLKELVQEVLEVTGSKSSVKWDPSKILAYDKGSQEANMEKVFSKFSWRPKHNMEAGIRKMVETF